MYLMMHAPRKWTADLAYLVGYITTDGSLSKDGRHIILVSKDKEHLEKINRYFKIAVKIGRNYSSFYPEDKRYYRLQFGGKEFYHWLVTLGLTANKTKSIGSLKIPNLYFADFL